MTNHTRIAKGAMGVGTLAAGLVGSALINTARAAADASTERAADSYARSVIREWEMALAVERARSRKLACTLHEARTLAAELDAALSDVSRENDWLRGQIERLKGRG